MAERPIILALTTMNERGMQILRDAGEVRMASSLEPEVLRREIADADAMVLRTSGVVDAALLDAAPRLKVIGRHGVGYDHIDIPAATARGVLVVTTPGANYNAVAEHVFALMIGLSKHFPQQFKALNEGRFHDRTKFEGRELTGRTIGIIGFGRIGRKVGAIAHRGFGMDVVYTDIVAPPAEAESLAGARRVDLEELLRISDYVTLHVPLDATTRKLINPDRLALMRRDAILINTCRGPVVDEPAVRDALDAGRLWGYGADVFDVEPPPADHPLVGRDDVMLTPHSAAQTAESLVNMATWMADDVASVLAGRPAKYPANDPAEVAEARRRLGKD